ncbi:SDR family oxidoreductase [Rouxiella silvae]|uniref:NADP-dependent 3-hydroxy acid dehydrogenase YdfG n=1 Tax=Rouxiella silvae TaxID=1646373 RepID=A0AA40X3T3_9GAMM|nr:SDR family oxidoreductase [Rouxiella silvae]KQN46529.1 AraC family transcriptional regulator [Serratia sp. Leaf50]MBF6638048.1 SDR family oxidoreductase [Rouxiella silvae]ORJ19652.1 SDR family oxidoreductase [Rouxiella silvae]
MSQTTAAKPLALVTGASTGIGATYAARLADRGYDLILVARDGAKMEKLAAELSVKTGVDVRVFPADLTDSASLKSLEQLIRDTPAISLLVNNAGSTLPGKFNDSDADAIDGLIRLNVNSLARLSRVALDGLQKHPQGAIINIASVLALAPEISGPVYAASKAFVLAFTQSLQVELADSGVYFQAVLPAATRTDIWEKGGKNVDDIQGVMEVGELVDAALAGFDKKERVTIPPLQDENKWLALDNARKALLPEFLQSHAAPRYR